MGIQRGFWDLQKRDWLGLLIALLSPLLAAAFRLTTVGSAYWFPSATTHWLSRASFYPALILSSAGMAFGVFMANGTLPIRAGCAVIAGLLGFAIFWITAIATGPS